MKNIKTSGVTSPLNVYFRVTVSKALPVCRKADPSQPLCLFRTSFQPIFTCHTSACLGRGPEIISNSIHSVEITSQFVAFFNRSHSRNGDDVRR